MSRRLRPALWPAGAALAVAAEWVAPQDTATLTAADAIAGGTLVALGLVAWQRRAGTLVGPLMAATGGMWFLGAFGGWALYLHRGPLAHVVLSYPTGRLRSRVERAAVGVAYVYALTAAGNDYATLAFAGGLLVLAMRRHVVAGGAERRARASALIATAAFAGVLALGAVTRLAGTGGEREVLALMAEGRSNKAICARLFLSPKTVEAHVRHIFMKLDIDASADDHRRVLAVLAFLRG